MNLTNLSESIHITPEALAEPRAWEFNEQVASEFETMLQRSIPDYEVMRSLVVELAASFASNQGVVLDLGCSRGETVARLIERLTPDSKKQATIKPPKQPKQRY